MDINELGDIKWFTIYNKTSLEYKDQNIISSQQKGE